MGVEVRYTLDDDEQRYLDTMNAGALTRFYDKEQQAKFVAEVIAEGMPSRRPNKVELEVRLVRGDSVRGPAKLVSPTGHIYRVNILGVSLYQLRTPETIDPCVFWLMVEGITSANIEPGLLLNPRQ